MIDLAVTDAPGKGDDTLYADLIKQTFSPSRWHTVLTTDHHSHNCQLRATACPGRNLIASLGRATLYEPKSSLASEVVLRYWPRTSMPLPKLQVLFLPFSISFSWKQYHIGIQLMVECELLN